jgi:hypothetical protein
MELKNNEVYSFPDGREFVARADDEGFKLYNLRLGVSSAPVYWVSETGQILFWGKVTNWFSEDLHDTGKMVLPEIKRLRLL